MRPFARWLVFVLVVWLPLQAAAVPLLVGCCPEQGAAAVADAGDVPCHLHAVVEQDAAPAHDGHAGHDGDRDHSSNPGHLCCPHFSAAPVYRFGLLAASERFDAPARAILARSHIPEQPQRPPRA
jgi:hypothetical protein